MPPGVNRHEPPLTHEFSCTRQSVIAGNIKDRKVERILYCGRQPEDRLWIFMCFIYVTCFTFLFRVCVVEFIKHGLRTVTLLDFIIASLFLQNIIGIPLLLVVNIFLSLLQMTKFLILMLFLLEY